MYCEMCGTRVDDDSVFCENCGTRIGSSRVRSKAARYVNIGSGQSLHRRNS